MADVFLSYAHEDRAAVEPIARALQTQGYAVWWDRALRPGETWDETIERELRTAACVIVAWSTTSVKSKWVRAEATDADGRQALVPVRLDATRLPVPFNLVQTEDLSAWTGDCTTDGWQRIMLQVEALAGSRVSSPLFSSPLAGEVARSAGGGNGSALTPANPPTPIVRAGEPSTGRSAVPASHPQGGGETVAAGSASRSTTLLTISALGILGAGWWWGAAGRSPVITTTVILAALAFLLFRMAEDDLSPGMKAMAGRWLLPVDGKVEISTVAAFSAMFEAVFGRKHFSWFCLWRSAVVSLVLFILITIAIEYFMFHLALWRRIERESVLESSLELFSFVFPMNMVGDYTSLLLTRVLLRLTHRAPARLLECVILDAIATLSFPFLVMFVVFSVIGIITGELNGEPFSLGITARYVWGVLIALSNPFDSWVWGDKGGALTLLYASLATSYLTCLWLILALICTPIVRLLMWSRTTGLTMLGRVLDAERRPMVALGYLTALVILAAGGVIWAIGSALAALHYI